MLGNHYNPPSALKSSTFHSMEELNELSRAIGRRGEYHQLGRGRVVSRWRSLHLEQFALTSHRLDKRVHARLSPPKGCVVLAIMPPSHSMLVDGVEFGNDEVLVVDANSEMDLVTPGKFACDTLILPECVFEETGQALFPEFRMHMSGGLTRSLQCPSSLWSALHGEMRNLLRNGSMSSEDVSRLLSRFLELMSGEPKKPQREVSFNTRRAGSVARRAREYIEEHYSLTIRMEDLCRYTGVSISTIQRSFSEYFQMSPFEYIKARRLNAARQALVAGDSSRNSVTQIAIENGFTHLGRFSNDYHEHFNELPRQTIVRSNRGS